MPDPFENFTPISNPIVNKTNTRINKGLPSLDEPDSSCSAVEASEAAQQCMRLAIKAVKQVLTTAGVNASDRIAAASFMRDTAHGKPTQQVSIRTNDGATLKDAVAFMERRRNELAIEGAMVVAEEENNAVRASNEEK